MSSTDEEEEEFDDDDFDEDCPSCLTVFSDGFLVSCRECGAEVTSKEELQEHGNGCCSQTSAGRVSSPSSSSSRFGIVCDFSSNDASCHCRLCKRNYLYSLKPMEDTDMAHHYRVVHEVRTFNASPSLSTRAGTTRKRDGDFYCHICRKTFLAKLANFDLKHHYATWHNSSAMESVDEGDGNTIRQQREARPSHSCDVCGIVFKLLRNLRAHRTRVHFDGKKIKCSWCEQTFRHKVNLRGHLAKCHESEGEEVGDDSIVWRCCKCDARLRGRSALKNHLTVAHWGSELEVKQCPECSYSAACRKLCQHLKNEHSEGATKKPFHCDLCGKGLTSNCNLLSHRREVHAVQQRGDESSGVKCDKCERTFKSRGLARNHSRKVHGDAAQIQQCPHCPFVGWPRRLQLHLRRNHVSSPGENRICSTCGKTCQNPAFLAAHIRDEHSGTRMSCEQCDRVFVKLASLRAHVRYAHGGEQVARPCPYCEYKTPFRHQLQCHVRAVHEKLKAGACHICGKGLSRACLASHLRSVHGIMDGATEKKYVCEKCGKTFAMEAWLLRHVTDFHKEKETTADAEDGWDSEHLTISNS